MKTEKFGILAQNAFGNSYTVFVFMDKEVAMQNLTDCDVNQADEIINSVVLERLMNLKKIITNMDNTSGEITLLKEVLAEMDVKIINQDNPIKSPF